jgi:hypothetical protein
MQLNKNLTDQPSFQIDYQQNPMPPLGFIHRSSVEASKNAILALPFQGG